MVSCLGIALALLVIALVVVLWFWNWWQRGKYASIVRGITGISNFRNYELREFHFRNYWNSDFQELQFQEFRIRSSAFQEFRLSEFQEFQDFRNYGFQELRILGIPEPMSFNRVGSILYRKNMLALHRPSTRTAIRDRVCPRPAALNCRQQGRDLRRPWLSRNHRECTGRIDIGRDAPALVDWLALHFRECCQLQAINPGP